MLAALLAIGFVVLFRTETGRSGIVGLAKEMADRQGLVLEIGSLGGALPFEMLLKDVRLADGDGEFLSLGGAAIVVDAAGLLQGRLALETVELRRLAIQRPPKAPPAASSPSGGGGLPPLPIAVRALSVKPVSLGPAFLGEAITLEILADTNIDPGAGINAGFTIRRLDGDGRIEGHLESDAKLSRLKASIRGETAPGGMVSRLIGLPGAPGVTVTLDGNGPIKNFAARYAITAGTAGTAGTAVGTEGEIRLSSVNPLALTVQGTGQVAALLPPHLRSLVANSVGYGLAASLNTENTLLEVVDFQVSTAIATAIGALKMRLDDLTVDARMSVELKKPDLLTAMVPGSRIDGGGAAVTVTGPLSGLAAEAKAWVEGAAFQENRVARIEVATSAIVAETIKATMAVTASGIDLPEIPDGALGDTIKGTAKGDLSGRSLAVSDIRLRSGPVELKGETTLDLKTLAADTSLAISHDAVGGLTPLLERGRIKADVHGRFDGRLLALQIGARLDDVGISDPNLARLTGGTNDLWLDVQQTSPTDWRVSDLEIDSGRLRIQARGAVNSASRTGDVEVTVVVPELDNLDPSRSITAGDAILSAAIQGGATSADIDWRLAVGGLAAERISVPRLEATGGLRVTGSTVAGDLILGAETSMGRTDATTSVGWDDGTLALSDLTIARGSDILTGNLELRPEPPTINGALHLSVPELRDWTALADLALQGTLAASVELSHGNDRQRVALEVSATDLRLDESSPALVDRIEVAGALEDVFGTPVIDGELGLSGVNAGAARADTLSLAATGPLTGMRLALQGTGAINDHAMRLDAASTIGIGETQTITVDQLTLTGEVARVTLKQPTHIRIAEGQAELETLSLALFGGEIAASGRMVDRQLSGALSLDRIALAPIADLAGVKISAGQLNAQASVSGRLNSPNGALNLVLAGVKGVAGEESGLPAVSLEITARMDDGALDGRALLSGLGADPLALTLKSRIPEPGGMVPVDARTSWRGDLGTLSTFLPLDGNTMDGDVGMDLTIEGDFDPNTGTFKPRRTSGGLTVSGGRFENFLAGTVLDPIRIDVALDGTRLIIRELDSRDTGAGTIKVTGSVDLAEPARPDVALDAVMDAMTIVRRDDAEVQLDARIEARTVEGRIRVAGTISNRNIDIRLIGNLPPGVEELTVEEIGAGGRVAPEQADGASASAGPPIDLDVEVSAPGRIFVRGRGLESEWGAAIQVSGTASEPILAGTVAPVRGGFEFAGRKFDLGEGGVTLSGDLKADPRLDLSAIHTGTGFTASVAVTGTARKPEVSLSSDPSYPEDEILALILFGRSTARLSAVEVLQLAQSTRTLLSGEAGTLDTIRKTIGVDVLTFAPGAGEDDVGRLKAGKYLRDDVYIGVEQGTAPGSSRSVVEWSVTPNLTVEGTVGSASQGTLGIQRRWEY